LPDASIQQDQSSNSSNSLQTEDNQTFPFPFLDSDPVDSDSESEFGDSDDLADLLNGHPSDEPSDDKIHGIIHAYLVSVKNQVASAIQVAGGLPSCYKNGQFWIHPSHPYFAMCRAENTTGGLNPTSLYHPSVFLWLPHLLDTRVITCPNPDCKWYSNQFYPMSIKGWNDNPIACQVVGLDQNYYIMTMQIQCRAKHDQPESGGCGKSYNLYDPVILKQFDS
jgi:hypothetical protein